ncbi:MAG: hypothetical protein U9N72_05290 [Bacteroidota bacterium]|nr:hypothetical protein [Bacteroidota bacterium]
MEETKQNAADNNSVEFTSDSIRHLDEARKWSMFLAILGFISVGLLVLVALFSGTVLTLIGDSSLSPAIGIVIAIFYLIMAVLYFFPVYYLFNFSSKAKHAVKSSDSKTLTESMHFFKAHYKFLGIMVIVMLALYPVIIALAVLGGIMGSL